MESLKAKGLELYAAYGNTTTDIRAYAAAGIPKVSLSTPPLQACKPSTQIYESLRRQSCAMALLKGT